MSHQQAGRYISPGHHVADIELQILYWVLSLTFQLKANDRVFVYMLMRDASLKQRIPCIIRISIFGAFSAEKSVHYTRVNTVNCRPNKIHLLLF